MIPFHRISVALPKSLTIGAALEQLVAIEGPPEEFWARGSPDSDVLPKRVLKAIPGLAAFLFAENEIGSLRSGWQVHRVLDGGRSEAFPLPVSQSQPRLAELLELAHGVPRRFPAPELLFSWRRLPWLGSADDLGPRENPLDAQFPEWLDANPDPALFLYRSGTSAVLAAWVRAAGSPDGKKPPALPATVQERLATLGKFKDHGLLPRFDAAEMTDNYKIGAQLQVMVNGLGAPQVALPHVLPPSPEPRDLDPLNCNHRDEADRVFRPLGYKPFPAGGSTGCIAYEKRSPAGNRLLLRVDFGTRAHRVSVILYVVGIGWSRWLPVDFGPVDKGSYAVNNPETYTCIIENCGAILPWLESCAVPKVDAAYPPTPSWWKLPAGYG